MQIELMLVSFVLREWKKNPKLRPIDLEDTWLCDGKQRKNYQPFPENEIARMRQFLREHAPSQYYSIFPDERQATHERCTKQFRHYLILMRQRRGRLTDDDGYIRFEASVVPGGPKGADPPRSDRTTPKLSGRVARAGTPESNKGCGVVVIGVGPTRIGSPKTPFNRFIHFCFESSSFMMDLPKTILPKREAKVILRDKQKFFFASTRCTTDDPSDNVKRFNPLWREYVYGEERVAGDDMAYLFFDLWNLPMDVRFLVTAFATSGDKTWEQGLPIE